MREHIHRIVTCAVIITLVGAPGMAVTDPATERASLVRLIHELEALEPLIREAEAGALSTQRIHFQYAWLRGDLERIKAGIREYLDTAPITPRAVPPLAGDYIR